MVFYELVVLYPRGPNSKTSKTKYLVNFNQFSIKSPCRLPLFNHFFSFWIFKNSIRIFWHFFLFLLSSYKSRDNFVSDVRQIFDNCEVFNEDDSPVGTAGHGLRKYFEVRWAELTDKHSWYHMNMKLMQE